MKGKFQSAGLSHLSSFVVDVINVRPDVCFRDTCTNTNMKTKEKKHITLTGTRLKLCLFWSCMYYNPLKDIQYLLCNA